MADDDDDSPRQGVAGDPAAAGIALGSPLDPRAAAYLNEQTRLARLQAENLIEQNAFELSHLRWRRFNDQMKGALQIMTVALGLLVVVGIAWAIWSASQADGLVVDAFSVPPSYAQNGVGGDVVADDMTAKIAAIRDFANDNSLARSNDVSEDSARDVKVEIPATGVSLTEAWNYLKLWFGHERHLTGNLRTLPDGRMSLTVSLGGANGFSFSGRADEIGTLEQKAAEQIFATVDPINIVLYFSAKGRTADMLAAARRNVEQAQGNVDQGEAYALYANMLRYSTGDVRRSLALAALALRLDPRAAPQHMEMLNSARVLGLDEEVLKQAREIVPLRREDNVGAWRNASSIGFPFVKQLGTIWRARETGDFARLAGEPCLYSCGRFEAAALNAEALARLHDPAGATATIGQAETIERATSGRFDPYDVLNLARVNLFIAVARDEPRALLLEAQRYYDAMLAVPGAGPAYNTLAALTQAAPLLGHAQAMTGDFAGAHRTIDLTPPDCYACVTARGAIDALQRNWGGSTYWFARAVARAPSIPFAYFDWGRMLLAKGDSDAAIAKFALAHEKAPHFADPLELWGEALIAKNRSDLAVKKFEEAARHAPNWGRLHLKWGEALLWSGRKGDAAKQFAIAASLYLTPLETTQMTRLRRG